MPFAQSRAAGLAATAALVAACATSSPIAVPEAPASLRAPAGQKLFLEAQATGVQIYECAPKADQPGTFEWAFRGPEANLADRAGNTIGRHYGGPTWEANDGSKVVADVKARDPGPKASAIPWLLLSARSSWGYGVMAKTASIQRLNTVGGIAPTTACDAGSVKQMARVPYTATYYFYSAP